MASSQDHAKAKALIRTKRGNILIDVGANDGYYSMLLRRNFKKVYAIEPFPKSVSVLKRNLRNGKITNVEVLPFAVGSRTGKTKMYLSLRGTKCHSLLRVGERTIIVDCYTLNDLFPDYEGIDLIKVDVEGGEIEVLLGAEKIMKNVKSWFIEMHDLGEILRGLPHSRERTRGHNDRIDKMLKGYGYETEWILERWVYAERKKC